MHVRTVRLTQFRAHEHSRFEFGRGLTLLHGPNGAGKTNVLEALHYCCLARSFQTSSDQYAVRRGASHLEVEAGLSFERRDDATVRYVFVPGEGKSVLVNGAPLERLVDVVGRFPVVTITPDDHRITDGGPDERRRLLDTILCQEKPRYLDSLMRYRRVLRQRNEMLSGARGRPGRVSESALAPWDTELVRHGGRITWYRARFLERFEPYLDEAFRRIDRAVERPHMEYRPFARIDGAESEDDVARLLGEALAERASAERDRGLTLVGPHRDELVLRLDDMEVRRYASHGQHRTFVLALRLAQFFHLKESFGESPLLLMDDVFDNLDPDRIRIFADLLTSDATGQAIVTAARQDIFAAAVDFDGDARRSIRIEEGRPAEMIATNS